MSACSRQVRINVVFACCAAYLNSVISRRPRSAVCHIISTIIEIGLGTGLEQVVTHTNMSLVKKSVSPFCPIYSSYMQYN